MIYHKHAHKQAAPQASPHARTNSNRSSPPRTVMQTFKAIMFLGRFVQFTHPFSPNDPQIVPPSSQDERWNKRRDSTCKMQSHALRGLGPLIKRRIPPPMIKRRVRRTQGRRQPPLLKICGCSGPVSSCGCSGPALAWRWTRWTFICPSWASMMKNA